MYQTIKKQIRPNTSVEFFKPNASSSPLTQECKDYIRDSYITNGKQLFTEQVVSEDGLELTSIVIWDSYESCEEFKQDTFVVENFINVRTAYFQANGITTQSIEEGEI